MTRSPRYSFRLERALAWGKRLFAVAATTGILGYLFANRVAVFELFSGANLNSIAAAIFIMAVVHFPVVSGFHFAHRTLGVDQQLLYTMSSYFSRLPARYVPGGIWHTAARYLDIRSRQALPKRIFLQIFVFESILVAASGFLVAGLASRHWLAESSWGFRAGGIAIFAAATLAFALFLFIRWFRLEINASALLVSIASFVLQWIIVGLGFATYARALEASEIGSCSLEVLSSTYQLAASLGYIAIFSPQGWGITELVFANLDGCDASLVAGVAAVAGFRIIGLIADSISYGTTMLVGIARSATRKSG